MRRLVRFDPDAIEDIRAIYVSLQRRFGKATADRSNSALLDHLDSFGSFPERGRRFDGSRPDLRMVGYRRTVTIVFQVEATQVTILRIFAAGRDVRTADF